MWSEVQPVLQEFLIAVLTGVLGVASAFLIALAKKGFDWISAKIRSIQQDDTRKRMEEANSYLIQLVNNTVRALNQTIGDDIRESITNGDGKYTKDDLLQLKCKAIDTIQAQLNEPYRAALETIYVQLDDYISDLIEAVVSCSKN